MIALLTGAGFSKPFGGFLAKDLSSFIIADPQLNPNVRTELVKTNNYEKVLGKYEKNRDSAQYQTLFAAMLKAFESHELMLRNSQYSGNEFGHFLTWLKNQNAASQTYWFTVNQDLLVETKNWYHVNMSHPGTRLSQQMAPTKKSGEPVRMLELQEGVDWGSRDDRNSVRYVKLHGSTHFLSGGSVAVIAGERKGSQLARYPVLARYFEEFERIITMGNVDLLVIGYSFMDSEVNEVLMKGCRSRLRMHIINPTLPSDWAAHVASPDCKAGSLTKDTAKLIQCVRSYFPISGGEMFPRGVMGDNPWTVRLKEALLADGL